MTTYDDLIGFDYTDPDAWGEFAREQLLPLHTSILRVMGLREHLEAEGAHLAKKARDDLYIRQAILGGVSDSGDYRENSLARVYRELLGIYINPKEWVSLTERGMDAFEKIGCSFEDTEYLRFISDLKSRLEALLLRLGISPQEADEKEAIGLLQDPDALVREVVGILDGAVALTANHCYHTLFTLHTRQIPRKYIVQAYPRLANKLDGVASFLGLEPKFTPEIDDEAVKKDYTVWGHASGKIADALFELNWYVWGFFKKIAYSTSPTKDVLSTLGFEAKNLAEVYYEGADSALKAIGWRCPKYLCGEYAIGFTHYYCDVNGVMCSKGGESFSLLDLLDDLSPALFLGRYFFDKLGKELEIRSVLEWWR